MAPAIEADTVRDSSDCGDQTAQGASPDVLGAGKRAHPTTFEASPWRSAPFHPIVAAAFPILSLYARNLTEVQTREIWHPLLIAILGSLAVWVTLTIVTRNTRKAAAASTSIAIAFFSYGHVEGLIPPDYAVLRVAVGPAMGLGLLALLWLILRSRSTLKGATSALNMASLFLIAPSCWAIGADRAHAADEGPKVVSPAYITRIPSRRSLTAGNSQPDIYYIILDAYARADSLKEFYGYDNAPFISALTRRGFYVAGRSRSNYDQTGYSLSSSLNMEYLDAVVPKLRASRDNDLLRQMIDENGVAAYLRQQGYLYVFVWTGVGQTRVDTADLELGDSNSTPPASFEHQVFGMSALDAVPQAYISDNDRHRKFILSAFDSLNSIASLPGPKFVFAHISAPHPPFVFGPNGEPIDRRGPYTEEDGSQLLHRITREQYRTGYVNQLQFINTRTLQAIDGILNGSRRPPIIILQGDHGSRMNLDWESLARTDLREPFSNLNAYLVPPRVRRGLYASITPVNSFRLLLSTLFGANLPPLPDRSFFSTVLNPLSFADVTDKIATAWSIDPNPAGH